MFKKFEKIEANNQRKRKGAAKEALRKTLGNIKSDDLIDIVMEFMENDKDEGLRKRLEDAEKNKPQITYYDRSSNLY